MGALLRRLILESLTQPKIAAHRLLGLSFPRDVMFQMAMVAAIISTIAQTFLLYAYAGLAEQAPEVADIDTERLRPLLSAIMQLAQIYFIAFCIEKFGKMFGGQGTFESAVLMTTFLSFMSAGWFVVLLLSIHISPTMALVVLLAMIYWSFWATANFVAVLHGFQSVLNTLVGVIVFGLFIALIVLIVSGIILSAAGITPTGTP
jgi:Yip1 domain